MPIFPVAPLILWGIALLLDSPWRTLFLVAHLLLLFVCAVIIVRDIFRLRKITRTRKEQGSSTNEASHDVV